MLVIMPVKYLFLEHRGNEKIWALCASKLEQQSLAKIQGLRFEHV